MTLTRRRFGALAAGSMVLASGCLSDDSPELEEDELLEVPFVGDPDADVTVTVYEDFTCPGCRQYKTTTYPEIEDRYLDNDAIRYEHRDFPVTTNSDWAYPVASAGRSVHEQGGNDAFFAFASEIYDYQDQYSLEVIEDVAEEVGVDGAQAAEAADEVTFEAGLDAEVAYAEEQGVEGTPWVVVDGEHVEDASPDGVITAIENARS